MGHKRVVMNNHLCVCGGVVAKQHNIMEFGVDLL